MKYLKKPIALMMCLFILSSISVFATSKTDSSLLADKVLAEVTALYTDYYTISNASAEVINTVYDDNGNASVTVTTSFDRTLIATSAEEMPYIQGLESALKNLTDANEIEVAQNYIDYRKNDLEENYIGKAQATNAEFIVKIPASVNVTKNTRSIAANSFDISNMYYTGTEEEIPASNLAPESVAELKDNGENMIANLLNAKESSLTSETNSISPMSRKTYPIQSYNRVVARDYAREWSCKNGSLKDHSSCHNPNYKFHPNVDCANFVSQCFQAGGLPTDETWYKGSPAWDTTTGMRAYVTDYTLFFHSTDCKKAFAGSIINFLENDGTNSGHVGIVDQNDTNTMTFCAHTRCRSSEPFPIRGQKTDYYIPVWDSVAGAWTPQ